MRLHAGARSWRAIPRNERLRCVILEGGAGRLKEADGFDEPGLALRRVAANQVEEIARGRTPYVLVILKHEAREEAFRVSLPGCIDHGPNPGSCSMATRTTTSRTATPQRARPRQSPSTPLRERRADIPVLAAHFLKYYAAANESDVTRFSDDALQLLVNHDWPGNVRQLQNAVEHGVVFAHADCIEVAHRQYGAAPTGS